MDLSVLPVIVPGLPAGLATLPLLLVPVLLMPLFWGRNWAGGATCTVALLELATLAVIASWILLTRGLWHPSRPGTSPVRPTVPELLSEPTEAGSGISR